MTWSGQAGGDVPATAKHGRIPGGKLGTILTGLTANQQGALLMVAAACGFTMVGALVKLLGQGGMAPYQTGFVRALVGFCAVLPFAWQVGPSVLRTRHPWIHLLRGLAGGTAMLCGYTALTLLPLAEVTALSFTTPLFVILLAALMLGERVRWRRSLATLVGFLGVIIMLRPGVGTLDPAAFLALTTAFGVALAGTLVKRLPREESRITMLLVSSTVAMALAALPAAFTWRSPSGWELGLLVAVGLLSVGSQSLMIQALKLGEATFVSPFSYSKLLLAGVIGYVLFAEVPDYWTLAGAAVIIASTYYIMRRDASLARPSASGEQGG